MNAYRTAAFAATLLFGLSACVMEPLALSEGIGPDPSLPRPDKTLVPTVNVAPAIGWPEGDAPVAAPGMTVTAFASGLDHPRWLYVLPNGDVLVAETAAPPMIATGLTSPHCQLLAT